MVVAGEATALDGILVVGAEDGSCREGKKAGVTRPGKSNKSITINPALLAIFESLGCVQWARERESKGERASGQAAKAIARLFDDSVCNRATEEQPRRGVREEPRNAKTLPVKKKAGKWEKKTQKRKRKAEKSARRRVCAIR